MASCEQTQAQLLAYLYDLLEAEERQALQTHLDQCPVCQAALERAKRDGLTRFDMADDEVREWLNLI